MSKPYHLVSYVINCSPMTKTFKTKKALDGFVSKFNREMDTSLSSGNFIDLIVTGITGEIQYYEELNETYKNSSGN